MNTKRGYTKRNRKWPGATLKEQAKNRYIAMWKLAHPGQDWPPPKPIPMTPEQKREKANAYMRARYLRLHGPIKRKRKMSDAQRREAKRIQRQNDRQRNPDKYKLKARLDYLKNREKRREKGKEWRDANPEKMKKIRRDWEKTEKGRIYNINKSHERRAKIKNCACSAKPKDIKAILNSAKRCRYCNKRFTKKNPATIDHVMPLVLGGAHAAHNLSPACFMCNSTKSGKHPDQFARELGLLMLV